MSNDVFPVLPGLTWGSSKTPIWDTKIKSSVSGIESRASYMSYPSYRVKLSYEVLRSGQGFTEFQTLIGFFNSHGGSLDDFLFLDDDDQSVTDQSFGTGDGVTDIFRLGRTLGGFYEPISATQSGSITVKKNGVTQTPTTHYTLSQYTGKVTFVTPPTIGDSLTWSGSYYWRTRFARDQAEFKQFLQELWENKTIELLTVKTK